MSTRKIRGRATILTVLRGLVLLAVLAAMFSTITNLFFRSLMEGVIGSADSSGQGAVSETPAQVNVEEPVPEPDEEDYDAQHDNAEGIIKNILVAQHKIQMIRVMIYWNNFLNWVGTGVVNSMGSPVMGW